MPAVREMAVRGYANKRWTTKKGSERGGRPFDKGTAAMTLDGSTGFATATARDIDPSTNPETSTGYVNTSASFTASAWVKWDGGATGAATAISQDGQNVSAFMLGRRADGHFAFTLNGADSSSPPSAQAVWSTLPQSGVWYHLAGVYDAAAGQINLYVNGRVAGTAAVVGTPWLAAGPTVFGAALTAGQRTGFWNGQVDDVRLDAVACTAAQLQGPAFAGAAQGGEFHFDEVAGSTAGDSSGGGGTLALQNGATLTGSGGKPGGALQLVGAEKQYAQSPTPLIDNTQSFVVSAWVKWDSSAGPPTANQVIVSQDGVVGFGFALMYSSTGHWRFTISNADGGSVTSVETSSTAPSPDQWVRLVAVYNATERQLRLYRGTNAAIVATLPAGVTPWQAMGPTLIGAGRAQGKRNQYFNGLIDDVNIKNVQLTDAQADAYASSSDARVPPGTPIDVGADILSSTTAQVRWRDTSVSGTSPDQAYEVYASTDGGRTYSWLATAPGATITKDPSTGDPVTLATTSATVNGLTPGLTYTFAVVAVGKGTTGNSGLGVFDGQLPESTPITILPPAWVDGGNGGITEVPPGGSGGGMNINGGWIGGTSDDSGQTYVVHLLNNGNVIHGKAGDTTVGFASLIDQDFQAGGLQSEPVSAQSWEMAICV